jgi:hypothetical protein
MMSRFLAAIAALSVLLSLPLTPADAGAQDPRRVLFVGNSLTATHDLPSMVEALARAAGDSGLHVAAVVGPGLGLEEHWAEGAALAAIDRGGWAMVVLQQGPSALPESRVLLLDYVRRFDARARKVGARTALYMVWPSRQRFGDFDRVSESYRLAAKEVGGVLLPAGDAWRAAWKRDTSIALYGRDGFHPSVEGTYLAALTIASALTKLPPGAFPATVRVGETTVSIPPDRAATLRLAAAEALKERHGASW